MRKIKVVHIITKLELGGAQENTLYTVQHLDKTKFDVYLLCGKGGILDYKTTELKNKYGVKIFFIKNLVREISPWKDFLALKDLVIKLDEIQPDIIHTHSSKAGILGRLAGYFLNLLNKDLNHRIKIVHTFHGFGFNKFQKLLVRNFYILLEYLVAKVSDKLIFVSKSNMFDVATKYKIGNLKNYVLIRSGIKISYYQQSCDDPLLKKKVLTEIQLPFDSKIVTTIGPFKPQKNLVDFIQVAKMVLDSNELFTETKNKLYFLIAGDGEQRPLLEKKVEEYNLLNKVKFLSWYTNIAGLLAITDIFVMTSLWEGLPRSALEALSSGVPVVAYNTDGLNDVIISDFNGYLVNIKDVNNLSLRIIELLNNKTKLSRLKNNAKNSLDKTFDIDYMVKQQEELYCFLVNLKF